MREQLAGRATLQSHYRYALTFRFPSLYSTMFTIRITVVGRLTDTSVVVRTSKPETCHFFISKHYRRPAAKYLWIYIPQVYSAPLHSCKAHNFQRFTEFTVPLEERYWKSFVWVSVCTYVSSLHDFVYFLLDVSPEPRSLIRWLAPKNHSNYYMYMLVNDHRFLYFRGSSQIKICKRWNFFCSARIILLRVIYSMLYQIHKPKNS